MAAKSSPIVAARLYKEIKSQRAAKIIIITTVYLLSSEVELNVCYLKRK